jgi:hypothetical protein
VSGKPCLCAKGPPVVEPVGAATLRVAHSHGGGTHLRHAAPRVRQLPQIALPRRALHGNLSVGPFAPPV